MSVYENLPDRPPMQRVWSGIIANNPSDFDKLADVLIPNLSQDIRFTDCHWQSRNDTDLPIRGNKCVVVIDENNEVWVVCWWPY